jgi:hypothetical protein
MNCKTIEWIGTLRVDLLKRVPQRPSIVEFFAAARDLVISQGGEPATMGRVRDLYVELQ